MLSAEAMRLAAVEVLCPTAARQSGEGFPTLAGINVIDSREVALQDIDPARDYTPVLSLHTRGASIVQRGDAAAADDTECRAVLEIVAELAVQAQDPDSGKPIADAMAEDDPEARLVLSALVSQVRYLLEFSPSGTLFRDAIIAVRQIDFETFGVPDLGLRWQRVTMRVTAAVPDDRYEGSGTLPEPLAALASRLPDGSYCKARLMALGAHFTLSPPPPLEGIAVYDDPDADPQADAPVAVVGTVTGPADDEEDEGEPDGED